MKILSPRPTLPSLLLGSTALLAGCAEQAVQPETTASYSNARQLVIAPMKMAEDCFPSQPGYQYRYQFSASKKLDFNVHYHVGSKMLNLVEERTQQKTGEFEITLDRPYCLMWHNHGSDSVELDYQISQIR